MGNPNWRRFLPLLFLISCTSGLPNIEGMDLDAWKQDKNGCEGKRSAMIDKLVSQKAKLLSLGELDIVELLGRPDQNELYTRNQKFYFYYVSAAPSCEKPAEKPKRLMIRFNAVGLAQEVLFD